MMYSTGNIVNILLQFNMEYNLKYQITIFYT